MADLPEWDELRMRPDKRTNGLPRERMARLREKLDGRSVANGTVEAKRPALWDARPVVGGGGHS